MPGGGVLATRGRPGSRRGKSASGPGSRLACPARHLSIPAAGSAVPGIVVVPSRNDFILYFLRGYSGSGSEDPS
jgi:hypothetical protein